MSDSPKKNDNYSLEEEIQLISRAKAGDSYAREELWKKLQRQIRKLVGKYLKGKTAGQEIFDDLVIAANQGLLRAYETFEPSRGNRLMTYATEFIKSAIRIEYWSLIGLPSELRKNASTVVKAMDDLSKIGTLENREDGKPDISQIAKKASVSKKKVERIVEFLNIKFEGLERQNKDGTQFEWLFMDEGGGGIEEGSDLETRIWEFREEDIGFVIPRVASHLIERWKKEDPERSELLSSAVESPNRCLKRRVVFANGARGMLDLSQEEINICSSGSDVYDNRANWKAFDHSEL